MEEEKENSQNTMEKVEETARDVANATKDGVKLAKDISTGNVVGIVNNSVNLLKNKTVRRHLIIKSIVSILTPILILLLIAGLFMSVISAIGDGVTDIINTMGEFFSGVGNWFVSLFDPENGKFIIVIDDTKFQQIKDTLASSGISAKASGLTDECLKLFILAQYKTQYTKDIVIKIEISAEEKAKIDKRNLGRTSKIDIETKNEDGTDKYYIKTEGCITLDRPKYNGNGELKYCEMKTLEDYENGNISFDDVKGKYSIDTSGNLVVPQKKSTSKYTGNEEKSDSGLLDLSKEEDNNVWEDFKNTTNVTEKEEPVESVIIPYQSTISSYTMPFEFLTILTTFTQNSEFGVAVAQLVTSKSNISLTILDNSKITEDRQIEQYNSHTTVDYRVGAKAAIPEGGLWKSFDNVGDIRQYVSDYTMLWSPLDSNAKKYETTTSYIKRNVTVTTEYSTTIQLKSVDTWLVKKDAVSFTETETKSPTLDDTKEPNPNIHNVSNMTKKNITLQNQAQDKYTSLQNFYDTNTNFKGFIDNYYNRDTGKNGIHDFRNDVMLVDGHNFVFYVDEYALNDLWRRFSKIEFNTDNDNASWNSIYDVLGDFVNSGQATNDQKNYFNNTVNATNMYSSEDIKWKIDGETYDIMPIEIINEKENNAKKNTYYVSEKTYKAERC